MRQYRDLSSCLCYSDPVRKRKRYHHHHHPPASAFLTIKEGLCSEFLFVTFMDRTPMWSQELLDHIFCCFLQMMVLLVQSEVISSSSWGGFAAKCNTVGMIINTSTLRHCFSAGKSWFLALRERNDFLPQVKKFKFLWILFISWGRLKQETARQTDVDAVPPTERVGEVVIGQSMFLTYGSRAKNKASEEISFWLGSALEIFSLRSFMKISQLFRYVRKLEGSGQAVTISLSWVCWVWEGPGRAGGGGPGRQED